mgnify:CR=1 FL=1
MLKILSIIFIASIIITGCKDNSSNTVKKLKLPSNEPKYKTVKEPSLEIIKYYKLLSPYKTIVDTPYGDKQYGLPSIDFTKKTVNNMFVVKKDKILKFNSGEAKLNEKSESISILLGSGVGFKIFLVELFRGNDKLFLCKLFKCDYSPDYENTIINIFSIDKNKSIKDVTKSVFPQITFEKFFLKHKIKNLKLYKKYFKRFYKINKKKIICSFSLLKPKYIPSKETPKNINEYKLVSKKLSAIKYIFKWDKNKNKFLIL